MIARDFKGNGFKGILDYLLDSSNRNGKIVSVVSFEGIDVPIATDSRDVFDPSRIAGSFRAQSSLRPRVGKPVRHIVLSCMDYDRARIGQIGWENLAREYMEKMGITDTQYIIVEHREKNNPHIHIVYNYIDNAGRTLDESNFRLRSREICREMTINHHLGWGHNKSISTADVHNPVQQLRYDMAKEITIQLYYSSSMAELQNRLLRKGIRMEIKYYGSNKGLVFSRHGADGICYHFSGRQLEPFLTYKGIEKIFLIKPRFNIEFTWAMKCMNGEHDLSIAYIQNRSRLESLCSAMWACEARIVSTHPNQQQSRALASIFCICRFSSKLSTLFNIMAPPEIKYQALRAAPPKRTPTPEERSRKYDEESAGRFDADLTDRRFEEKLR